MLLLWDGLWKPVKEVNVQTNRIVCGELPQEDVKEFLAYIRELVKGVEAGSVAPSTGLRRIVATQGYEVHVRHQIKKWKDEKKEQELTPPRWACSVTTIPARTELFSRTIQSLLDAGFPAPDVYVDGSEEREAFHTNTKLVHYRTHNIKTFPHWLLTLVDMYLRDAEADRYAIFQDDLVCCKGLRDYLDSCPFPKDGYWNLFTIMGNDYNTDKKTREQTPKQYPFEGWHLSNQLGQGGLGLVFDNEAVLDLITQRHMYERMWDHSRRYKYMDGAVVTAMNVAGRKELIHVPSLVQHTGQVSSIGNDWSTNRDIAATFKGEDFDARSLIRQPLCETP
jgi:hypothetical protein